MLEVPRLVAETLKHGASRSEEIAREIAKARDVLIGRGVNFRSPWKAR
ncbi:MAG: hypothetical protein R3C55_15060 [Parvularculaceae bacterium]